MKKIIAVIKGFFAKDFWWKMFSLAVAVILWFVVMNTLNPTEVKTFTTNLAFTNEAALTEGNSLVIINKKQLEETKVTVKIRGTRPALDEISKPKNKAEIGAYVDLSQFAAATLESSPQDLVLTVTPELPKNTFIYSYEIVSCSPKNITAKMDNLKAETYKLNLQVNGQLKAGYNAAEPVCDTDTVTVKGPASLMEQVAEVRAAVDIKGKTDSVNVSVAPAVYDSQGNVLELFTVEPSVIDVSVDISKQWAIPVAEPQVIGSLNPSLALESIDYEPKTVQVVGGIEDINKVPTIQLPAIDLAQVENTKTFSYDIRPSFKDTDIQLMNPAYNQVKVTVKVISKEIVDVTLKEENFKVTGLGQGLEIHIEDAFVTLYGANIQASVTGASLQPTLDVTNRGSGRYNMGFGITLPEGVELQGVPRVNVTIAPEQEATTQAETQTEPQTQPTTQEEPKEATTEEEAEEPGQQ